MFFFIKNYILNPNTRASVKLINRLISEINTQFFRSIITPYINIIITPGYCQSILLRKKSLLGLFKILAVPRDGPILKLDINPAKILKYINPILAVSWL